MSPRLHLHDDEAQPSDPNEPVAADLASTSLTWEETLADLEANVDRVGAVTAPDALPDAFIDLDVAWVPPADLGPLPDHLRERAALLLSRQLAVAEQLVHDITWSKQQRDVAARLSYAKTRPAGAFFDNKL